MAHDQHDHHGHDHHGHDHHHHGHHSDEHHHHWDCADYVQAWIARDDARQGERQPIIERLIAAIPYPRNAPIQVLDVGGGAGIISGSVLSAFSHAIVTIQDYSQPMLDGARARLDRFSPRVRFVLSDLRDPAWAKSTGGPFDLAVSGIAVHNLYDMAAMATCYEAVRSVLKPGGCFLDYDHFDRVGGVPLHQHMLKVAGFAGAEVIWHKHPTAIIKANT